MDWEEIDGNEHPQSRDDLPRRSVAAFDWPASSPFCVPLPAQPCIVSTPQTLTTPSLYPGNAIFTYYFFHFPSFPNPSLLNVIAPFSSYRTVSAVRVQGIACLDRLEGLESTRMAVKRTGTYQSLVVNNLPIIRKTKNFPNVLKSHALLARCYTLLT